MSSRSSFLIPVSLALSAVALCGCTDFKRAIGLEKVVPDEFAVVARAPLSVPPDYTLRPPRAGEPRPQEAPTSEQARQTVFRAGDQQQPALPPPTSARSPGESELLSEAGAGSAPPNIRQLVNTEAAEAGVITDSFVDRLVFWKSQSQAGSPAAVINPEQEALRLNQPKTAVKPPEPSSPATVTYPAPSSAASVTASAPGSPVAVTDPGQEAWRLIQLTTAGALPAAATTPAAPPSLQRAPIIERTPETTSSWFPHLF